MPNNRLGPRKTVLVIDDDADIAQGLADRIAAHGYKVSTALDAQTGIHATRENRPDLIILDLGLPDGDGLAVLEELRRDHLAADFPVVVLTARDTTYEALARESGAQLFLQKPVDNERLIEVVASHVSRFRGAPNALEDLESDADGAPSMWSRIRDILGRGRGTSSGANQPPEPIGADADAAPTPADRKEGGVR